MPRRFVHLGSEKPPAGNWSGQTSSGKVEEWVGFRNRLL